MSHFETARHWSAISLEHLLCGSINSKMAFSFRCDTIARELSLGGEDKAACMEAFAMWGEQQEDGGTCPLAELFNKFHRLGHNHLQIACKPGCAQRL